MLESVLGEFREEAAITKRVLERVPAAKLSWKPHPKSMSLGQLAMHIARVPGALARITRQDGFDVSQGSFDPPSPKNVEEIHAALDRSVREVEEYLKAMTEQTGGQLASDAKRKRALQQASDRRVEIDHAEPLVPPPRPAVGLPPAAGSAGPGDLWTQRG